MDETEEQAEGSAPEGSAPEEPAAPAPLEARRHVDPQRLVRIASVTREVLEEARRMPPEPAAVEHLRQVHERIRTELEDALPPELFKEFRDLTPDLRSASLEELSLAHAEILGWLEGLFQGTQIALQMQALQQRTMPPSTRDTGGAPREPDPRYL
jgi:Protein of unknown function (DUF2587)